MTFNMLQPTWFLSKSLLKCNNINMTTLTLRTSMTTLTLRTSMSTAANSRKEEKKMGSTINPEEIKKFSEHSEQWWNENGLYKALHCMNGIRIPFVRDGLVQCPLDKRTTTPLKDKKILDVGCGGGILSEALARIGAEVTGIDATKDLLEVAKRHSESNNKLINKPTYLCTTIEDHAKERKDYYDGVVASEVIEHVNNKELFVNSCVNVLKPGGRIFFTTPNRTRVAQVLGIYMAEYVLNLVPRGTHQYEMFITPNELTFLLERSGCHVEIVYGGIYNNIMNKWDFISSQALWYALQAQKLQN